MFSSSLSSLSSLSDEEVAAPRRRRRHQVQILNCFDRYDDEDFRKRFRLRKETVLHLVALFGERLETTTTATRRRAVKPVDQILIALRYFATGTYQRVIGDVFNVDQSTVHRIVHRVAQEIARLKPSYINMPSPQEQARVAYSFYELSGIPRVLGAVDCTHVKITSPGGLQAETFRNRKGFFSINVHMVTDANLQIRNVVARWPGSCHDSTIFNDSPLCAQLERGDFGNMFLLGDSGYPCRSYLLTPILNPATPAQEAFNCAQIKTRGPVERLFGVLKRRFPCLHFGIGVKIDKVPNIIVACAVLHNIALAQNDNGEEEEDLPEVPDLEVDSETQNHNQHNINFNVRNDIINTHFTV